MKFIAYKFNLKDDVMFYEKIEETITDKTTSLLWDHKDRFYYDRK